MNYLNQKSITNVVDFFIFIIPDFKLSSILATMAGQLIKNLKTKEGNWGKYEKLTFTTGKTYHHRSRYG